MNLRKNYFGQRGLAELVPPEHGFPAICRVGGTLLVIPVDSEEIQILMGEDQAAK